MIPENIWQQREEINGEKRIELKGALVACTEYFY